MYTLNDFFCGCGGLGLGFQNAGFKIVGAWDFDKYAVATYRENVGDHVVQADIQKMCIEDVPKADVWAFGFPCQDLSVAGKQAGIKLECADCGTVWEVSAETYSEENLCPGCGGTNHRAATRSGMFFEIMRLLAEAREREPEKVPKVLVAENVKALRKLLPVLEAEYGKAGYKCHAQLFNSKYWGVPQNRERYIVVGTLDSLPDTYTYPEEQHDYFPWGDIKKLPKWDTKALKTLLEDHNITLGDGYLRLVYQMVDDNGTPFRDELKTDLSRRSLMITEEMVLLLIFWRLIQNTEKKKAAERGIEYNPDNLVFCTRKGTYIYPRNFTKMWSENLRSMGIDHKRFHDLRHTVATVMLEDGEAMNTVQEQLGHYDAGFTASRYGHVTAKMRNSAAVKLGERLEKVRNPEAEDAEDANSVKNEDTVIPFQEGRKLKSAACKIK